MTNQRLGQSELSIILTDNHNFSFVEDKFGGSLDNKELRTLISRVILACVDTNRYFCKAKVQFQFP